MAEAAMSGSNTLLILMDASFEGNDSLGAGRVR